MFQRKLAIFPLLVLTLIIALAGCGQPLAQKAASIPTPMPTATLMSGWKRLENKGVSIALPDTFVGGDLTAADKEMITNSLEKFGDEFKRLAETIKQNPDIYLLFGIDTEPTSSGVFNNLIIVHEKVLSVIDPAAYMKAIEKQLPAQFKVKSRNEMTLFGEPAGQMVIEASLANKNVTEVIYVFKRDGDMYVATYTTGRDDFEEKLPIFEQSIQTLIIDGSPD